MQFESQGFLFFVFSSQDSSQIELLKELLDLQKDMIVMMLSLLEGLLFDDSTYKLSWHHPFFKLDLLLTTYIALRFRILAMSAK